MKLGPFLLFLALTPVAFANDIGVEQACVDLCDEDDSCASRCVKHAELFEVKANFIQAVAAWSPSQTERIQALRSGANLETFVLCKQTGWAKNDVLTCLRSYPTASMIQSCKRMSALAGEQVRCLRTGKSEAEVDACSALLVGGDQRLACLEKSITAQETHGCQIRGADSKQRLRCLETAKARVDSDSRAYERETRDRIARETREEELTRMPASKRAQKNRLP